MDNEFKRIVEINGIKIEVDMRTAKRVDEFKVGDLVKVLVKDYNDYKSYCGTIIGFDEFKSRPTIVVAYVKDSYSEVELKFAYINQDTPDVEIAPIKDYEYKIDFAKIQNYFDMNISKAEHALGVAREKKDWFNKNYGLYFKEFKKE